MIKYTKDHDWLDSGDDGVAVGLTDHATSELGDVVYVELPEVGTEVTKGEEIVVIESTKATSGIVAPFDGVITEVNQTPLVPGSSRSGQKIPPRSRSTSTRTSTRP